VGTVAGAVYTAEFVDTPELGNDPQSVVELHVTLNVTPSPLVSFSAFAVNVPLVPTVRDVGPEMVETLIDKATIDRSCVLVADGSPVTAAFSVTSVPIGICDGAV
jgi:hypothetical protein